MKTFFSGLLVCSLLALGNSPARAQFTLGPEISIGEDVDLGIGVVFETPLDALEENLEFAGRFTFYFPDRFDYWELDGDVRYLFPLQEETSILPYALAGLAIGRTSFDYDGPGEAELANDTEIGLRLGGGFKVPMDRVTPFAELGLGVGDIPDFTLRAGLGFPIG